jgi:hypothetical protein
MFGLDIDGLVMRLDCKVVLFEFIMGCAQVPVVGCYFGVDFNGFGSQSNFLLEVAQLAQSLALEVHEITGLILIAKVQSLLTDLGEFFPFFEVQVSVGEEEVLLFGAGHTLGQLHHLFVLFFGFELLDFLGGFLVHLEHHGTAVLEIVKLHLHQ